MDSVDRSWVASVWPRPQAHDDKYSRGVVGIVAGSEAYPGAAVLVACGAARAGVGMVRYVGPRRAQDLVLVASARGCRPRSGRCLRPASARIGVGRGQRRGRSSWSGRCHRRGSRLWDAPGGRCRRPRRLRAVAGGWSAADAPRSRASHPPFARTCARPRGDSPRRHPRRCGARQGRPRAASRRDGSGHRAAQGFADDHRGAWRRGCRVGRGTRVARDRGRRGCPWPVSRARCSRRGSLRPMPGRRRPGCTRGPRRRLLAAGPSSRSTWPTRCPR